MSGCLSDNKMLVLPNSMFCSHVFTKVYYVISSSYITIDVSNMQLHVVRMRKEIRLSGSGVQWRLLTVQAKAFSLQIIILGYLS